VLFLALTFLPVCMAVLDGSQMNVGDAGERPRAEHLGGLVQSRSLCLQSNMKFNGE